MTWLRRLWHRFTAGCATLPEWDGGWCDWDGVKIETQGRRVAAEPVLIHFRYIVFRADGFAEWSENKPLLIEPEMHKKYLLGTYGTLERIAEYIEIDGEQIPWNHVQIHY